MRYSGYYACRECGKTWWHKSDYIPFEAVDWWYDILFSIHCVINHSDKLKFKQFIKGLKIIFKKMLVAILWVLVTITQIIFYPFKLIIDLLY